MSLNSKDLILRAEGRPGIVTFENYEELKARLSEGLKYYNACEYSLDCIDLAKANRDDLKAVKKVLETKKKEMKKSAMRICI
jgi:hypothetical protein